MANDRAHRTPTTPLQTSFLIPNLHCPTCITHITSLMSDISPAPIIRNISIINHIVTVAHARTITANLIGTTVESAGYEIFDIILDPTSNEEIATQRSAQDAALEEAVDRWDPKRYPLVDGASRDLHDAHCKMCADHDGNGKHGSRALESVAISDPGESAPQYLAVLSIGGMTCSSCIRHVTDALQNLPAVERADVTLIGHSANVQLRTAEGAESVAKELERVVEEAGYDAQLMELKPVAGSEIKKAVEDKDDAWEATYSIEGMTCSSCVGAISNAVKELSFVDRADVNLIGHSATVAFSGKNHEPGIQRTLEEIGYGATLVDLNPVAQQKVAAARTVSLRIDGMHCPRCPKRVIEAARQLPADIQKTPTLDSPILTIAYVPNSPTLTIRRILQDLREVDPSFTVSIHKPMSLEQRSREMLKREKRSIFLRVILAVATAIPSLIIGVVYMNLVSSHDSNYMYLMQPLHGVSRAEWATFILATSVYFFAADHFHRRMLREIFALWRPGSPVPITKRLYRFGSMNILISLGTTIAYFSSLAQLILAASHPASDLSEGSKQSYFDSVVFLTMFLLLGRLTEAHMKAKAGDAVSALGKLRPAEANLVIHGSEGDAPTVEKVNGDLIDTGDFVNIPHGYSPPCDGTLLDKSADMDESALTGESRVVGKQEGDAIFSGTINRGSAITIRVTGPAGASMLDSIIQIVREGQSKRAPMEQVADLLTAYFVPVVVLIAITTWIVWLALGLSGTLPLSYLDSNIGGWPFWSLQFAIAVFVIACPCGLGLAAPTALFVASGLAAGRGILVKGGGEAFQEASNLGAVVFDKTGTLTEGAEPGIVQHRVLADGAELDQCIILGILKGVEENSNHPLARAAVSFANAEGTAAVAALHTEEIAGKGLKASVRLIDKDDQGHHEVLVGNEALLRDYSVPVSPEAAKLLESWKSAGYSVILLATQTAQRGWRLSGIFAASDPLRPEAAAVIRSLQVRGVEVWMLSGDNPETANAVGSQVNIPPDNIIAGVLPTEKADKVRYLQRTLKPRSGGGFQNILTRRQRTRATIAMVGDGINDAPALAAADVGIAVASGSDIAVQSAAFVLVHSDLRAVLTLVSLSRVVFRRVILNFFWAACYNMIALPVAAGVLYPIKTGSGSHVRLDPAWAALAMALSSVSVVGSSLLLRTRIPGVGFRE